MADGVPSVEYRPAAPGRGLEVFTTDSLFARVGKEELGVHRRLTFHTVQLILAEGRHEVDFTPHALEEGSLLHLRPGQVHRWLPDAARGFIVVFPDGPWAEPLGPGGSTPPERLDEHDITVVRRTLNFARDRLAADPPSSVIAGLREFVIAEVAAGRNDERAGPAPYLALIDRLEAGELSRSIGEHAAAIGYSERTISRACQEAVGLTAKQVVDQRVALEARRRLTDTGVTTAAVARALGFSEATNFVKFFRRLVGMTPTEWQDGLRRGSA